MKRKQLISIGKLFTLQNWFIIEFVKFSWLWCLKCDTGFDLDGIMYRKKKRNGFEHIVFRRNGLGGLKWILWYEIVFSWLNRSVVLDVMKFFVFFSWNCKSLLLVVHGEMEEKKNPVEFCLLSLLHCCLVRLENFFCYALIG